MLAPTKKPLTKAAAAEVEFRVKGPEGKRKAVEKALKQLGFTVESETVPWRDAFAQLGDEDMQGRILRGTRTKEGLTQMELAHRTGIPQRHLSEMEHGKRPIGKKIAAILAEVLQVDYRVFL